MQHPNHPFLPIRSLRIALAIVLGILFSQGASAAIYTVEVGPEFAFQPSQLTIAPGDTVVWEWSGLGVHTVTSGTGPLDPNNGVEFNSGAVVAAPFTFSHTFNSTGTFDYYCAPHLNFGMTGVVNVVENGATYFVEVGPGFAFQPATVNAAAGDTVVWDWSGVGLHTVTSGTGPLDPNVGVEFNSGAVVAAPFSFSHIFNTNGSYDYYCAPHLNFGMTGVINVPEPSVLTQLGFGVLLVFGIGMRRRRLRAVERTWK